MELQNDEGHGMAYAVLFIPLQVLFFDIYGTFPIHSITN